MHDLSAGTLPAGDKRLGRASMVCISKLLDFLWSLAGQCLCFGDYGQRTYDFYQHYKFYHFFAVCFGLGCGTALYRPYRSLAVPSAVAVLATIIFEVVGIVLGVPAQTKSCRGPPYDRRVSYWGLCVALLVAVVNLNSYHVYTLSYGCGIIIFAVGGAIRKCSFLWEVREELGPW